MTAPPAAESSAASARIPTRRKPASRVTPIARISRAAHKRHLGGKTVLWRGGGVTVSQSDPSVFVILPISASLIALVRPWIATVWRRERKV